MKLGRQLFILTAAVVWLSGCGISLYPGQPGMVTNGYCKIDLENLDPEGLWVYEVVYDNSTGGKGVGAIVTKLYAGAQTYTSNVRTNADGTLYRVKAQYDGADLQMISVPSLNQIHVSPNSKVQFLLEYTTSLDEIDDKNIAEQSIFKPLAMSARLNSAAMEAKANLWSLLKAGTFRNGILAYEVESIDLDGAVFKPAKPVAVETSLGQNAVKTSLTPEVKNELMKFVEANFAKGFKGKAKLKLKGSAEPVAVRLGIHSFKTAQAAGIQIIRDASFEIAETILSSFRTQEGR